MLPIDDELNKRLADIYDQIGIKSRKLYYTYLDKLYHLAAINSMEKDIDVQFRIWIEIIERVQSMAFSNNGGAVIALFEHWLFHINNKNEDYTPLDSIILKKRLRGLCQSGNMNNAVEILLSQNTLIDSYIIVLNEYLVNNRDDPDEGELQGIIIPLCKELFLSELELEFRGMLKGTPVTCCSVPDGLMKTLEVVAANQKLFIKPITNVEKIQEGTPDFVCHIIVEKIRDCYKTLVEIHTLFKPLARCFKDYVALPIIKNGIGEYRAIHTTVEDDCKNRVLFIIQTMKMVPFLTLSREETEKDMGCDFYPSMFSTEFRREYYFRFYADEKPHVYFTPKNDRVLSSKEMTALDFAYCIHTDIGNHFKAAVSNGKVIGPSDLLEDLATVEIITDDNIWPTRDWITLVHKKKSKKGIRKALNVISETEAPSLPIKPKVFISVASEDIRKTDAIKKTLLENRFDVYVYTDMRIGSEIRGFMNNISSSDYCIFFISDKFLTSIGCMLEAQKAFNQYDEDELRKFSIFKVEKNIESIYNDFEKNAFKVKYVKKWERLITTNTQIDITGLPEYAIGRIQKEIKEATAVKDFIFRFMSFIGDTWNGKQLTAGNIMEEIIRRDIERKEVK